MQKCYYSFCAYFKYDRITVELTTACWFHSDERGVVCVKGTRGGGGCWIHLYDGSGLHDDGMGWEGKKGGDLQITFSPASRVHVPIQFCTQRKHH